MTVLYIVGFPSLYGGAGAELYHQVRVWETLGVTLHFIPTQKNVRKAALYGEMTERGHMIHDAYDWSVIPEGAPVISFCNEDFLAALPEIRRRTRRTVFVNCMTWLFGKEKEAMSRGDIALFLYQNDKVMQFTKTVRRVRLRISGSAVRKSSLQKLMTGASSGMAAQS